MPRERTADHLRDEVSRLRQIAGTAEDECVRQVLLANAEDLDRLIETIRAAPTGDDIPKATRH